MNTTTRIVTGADGTLTYHGPAIHDGSPRADVLDALYCARTMAGTLPRVAAILVERLTAQLDAMPAPVWSDHVKTSELRTGDVVATGAGRVLLGDRRVYGEAGAEVYRFDGRILDFDPEESDTHRWVRGVNRGYDAPDAWAVQGNDLARWSRLV
jgi:hypothetical protein